MKRHSQVLAVTLLAMALCADRIPAPAATPQVVQLACRLAGRLTTSLRQSIPANRLHADRAAIATTDPIRRVFSPAHRPTVHPTHAADRFRLPPPRA